MAIIPGIIFYFLFLKLGKRLQMGSKDQLLACAEILFIYIKNEQLQTNDYHENYFVSPQNIILCMIS